MGTQADFHGGSKRVTISADTQLHRHGVWTWHITASGAGLAVQLPDARKLINGYPVIRIVNEGANTFAIEDFDGTEQIATASNTQNKVWTFALYSNTASAGDWEWTEATQGSASGPAATVFPWTLGSQDFGREAWRYDFLADTWAKPGGDSTNFHNISCGFEVSGFGFVVDSASNVEKLDPSVWSTVTSSPNRLDNVGGGKHPTDDKGYSFGGITSPLSKLCWEYDLSGDAWTAMTDLSAARNSNCAQKGTNTNCIYHGGSQGFTGGRTATTATFEYDIVGDAHNAKTSSTLARLQFGNAIDSDGDYWVYGGGNDPSDNNDDVEQYDISADSWTTETLSPQGDHSNGGASHIAASGNNYTIGGAGGTANDDATYEHNPDNDTYVLKADHGAVSSFARGISSGSCRGLTD